MKIFLWIIVFILSVILFSVLGNYAGGALYLHLSGVPATQVTWWTLYEGIHLPFKHHNFASAVWGSVLTAWIVFLPVLIMVIYLWLYFMPKSGSLYGNARFANNKELEVFHYKSDQN
jgi:hypothetical protein